MILMCTMKTNILIEMYINFANVRKIPILPCVRNKQIDDPVISKAMDDIEWNGHIETSSISVTLK